VVHDWLSDEQRELRDLVRRVAAERVAPRAAGVDATGEFPWDVVEALREAEILALPFAERHGGTGTGTLMLLVAIEELSKVCATTGLVLAVQALGAIALDLHGSEEQKDRYLPRLASGEWLAAYALTEPGSGSDSAAMLTTARRDGDEYVLSGSKRFITNAGVATLYTVFAKTDPEAAHRGISCFLVEAGTPGFEVGRIEPKMGIKGSTTGELFFTDCRVPAANRVGEEGEGFRIAMRVLDRSRPGIAAQALGIAQGATDYALEYSRHRETFGRPIAEHQMIQALLADMETKQGVTFPLADFVADDPAARLLGDVRSAFVVGLGDVDGTTCNHLAFSTSALDWQIWIDTGERPVPRKVVITYRKKPSWPQYAALLSQWEFPTSLPDERFATQLPDDAHEIDFVAARNAPQGKQ